MVVSISDDDGEEELDEPMETTGWEESLQPEGGASHPQRDSVLMAFVRRYCRKSNRDVAEHALLPDIFSRTHPKDIVQACTQTPYCLYLFVGVELEGGRRTSVLLIGYCDRTSGKSVLRLLQMMQLSADAEEEDDNEDEEEGKLERRNADADLLVETLQKFLLPLSNLAVFYSNAPYPALGSVLEARLRQLCPAVLSLCGLPGVAHRALESGLSSGTFSCVLTLLRDLQRHCTDPSCRRPHHSKRTLAKAFSRLGSYDPTQRAALNCASILVAVETLASSWRELLQYFKAMGGKGDNVGHITAQLMDHKVKLHFLFLLYALHPLRSLEVMQRNNTHDQVAEQLQRACSVITFYAAVVLDPVDATCFLQELDVSCLGRKFPLKPEKVAAGVGCDARDFLCATAVVDLSEADREEFLQSVTAFYQSVLETLVRSVPVNLGQSSLLVISSLLKQPTSAKVGGAFFVSFASLCELELRHGQLRLLMMMMMIPGRKLYLGPLLGFHTVNLFFQIIGSQLVESQEQLFFFPPPIMRLRST